MRPAIVAALGVLALSAAAGAQSREFTRTVDLESGGRLRIVGTKGSMRVTPWEQPQVEVRARIERPDDVDPEYASQAVEATRIEVSGDRRSVSVVSDYSNVPALSGNGRRGERREPAIHYDIRAPRKIVLDVNSDRGPVSVSGFEGTIDVVVDRGELDLRDVSGDLRVEIDRGDNSRIQGVTGGLRLDADRTDLDIDAQALDRRSRIEIDRGDVELRIPDAQRLTVRTDISRRGRFHTDLPIQWTSPDPRRSEGHINGGGTELVVESDRARIDLRRRHN